jgi:hypothetical protein
MAFFELRQYTIRPGKMAEWLALMENEIIPFQVAKGAVICASFRGEEDESVYVWVRRFEDEAAREKLYAEVYESEEWKTKFSPRVAELIYREKNHIQRIVPTRMSPIQ